jgi:hypothetical protein
VRNVLQVRMYWEPNFQPPPVGRWVQYLPWEFGLIPQEWVRILNKHADEVTSREHSRNIQGTFSVIRANAREPPSQLQEALKKSTKVDAEYSLPT